MIELWFKKNQDPHPTVIGFRSQSQISALVTAFSIKESFRVEKFIWVKPKWVSSQMSESNWNRNFANGSDNYVQ